MGSKTKMKLHFSGVFCNPPSEKLVSNRVFERIDFISSYLKKFGPEKVSGVHFLDIFCVKIFIRNTLSIDQVSKLDLLYFSKY